MSIRIPSALAAMCLLAACTAAAPDPVPDPAPVSATPVAKAPVVEAPPSTATADPAPALESPVPESFIVSTNEPFWQARVEGGTVVLLGPEGERTLAVASSQATADGRRVRASDAAGSLEVVATAKPCQDDMSGAAFPFTGQLSFDGQEPARGCARRATDPPPQP